MTIIVPLAQTKGGSFVEASKTLRGSEHMIAWLVFIVAVLILAWAVWALRKLRSESRRAWRDLIELSHRAGLSREEFGVLRRRFRRSKIKDPMSIMRSERIYISFFESQTQPTEERVKQLIRSIQRKIFGAPGDHST